ncbi:MAG: Rieske 2Fe-2S domain-containing protein [bacterium]
MPDAVSPPLPGMPPKKESILSRREFIRNTVRFAVAGAVIPGLLTQLLPSVAPAALSGGGPGPIIKRDPKSNAKIPVTIEDLAEQPGNNPFVGEYSFLPAIAYKVRVDVLRGSSQTRGFNTAQHAVEVPGDAKHAVLAYVGKCKHLGCTVGWNGGYGGSLDVEDYDGDGVNDGRILCPCHGGQYDIHNLALNVPGTPPPAPLNVIRFNVVANYPGDEALKIPAAKNALIGVETLAQLAYRDADRSSPGSAFKLRKADHLVKPKDYSWESSA